MNHRTAFPAFQGQCFVLPARHWLGTVDDDALRTTLLAIYDAYTDIFDTAKGSTAIHQAWEGGLKDHLAEVFGHARDIYEMWRERYGAAALSFSWDEVVVAVFCHDAEKLLSHGPRDNPEVAPYHRMVAHHGITWDNVKWALLESWSARFGLVLSPAVVNAIKYTHGEGKDYCKDRPVMGQLATLVGNADRASARGFPDEGRGRG